MAHQLKGYLLERLLAAPDEVGGWGSGPYPAVYSFQAVVLIFVRVHHIACLFVHVVVVLGRLNRTSGVKGSV